MKSRIAWAFVSVAGLIAQTAVAVTIETVPVGNPGNAGELSGAGAAGGYGPDRICGKVDYTYNIGKYEVTAGQYAAFLNAVAETDTYGLYKENMSYGCGIMRVGSSGSYWYSIAGEYVNRPVNLVSYWDACRFANWLSNGQPTGAQGPTTTERGTYTLDGYNGLDGRTIQRNPGSTWALVSEDEWYKAAYYKGGSTNAGYWDYPTGSDIAPGRDMNDASGNNAGYSDTLDWPSPTTLAGEFQNSESPYGTFDQGGNVWEWNEDVVYQGTAPRRGLRGGAFTYDVNTLLASYRFYAPPTTEGYAFGFRLVQVPEPTSTALLTLGAVGMLVRRSKGNREPF